MHENHFEKMSILAIGAHPDDIEFGCGGTLIKYAEKGHDVFLLVMTKGEMGGDSETRSAEQEDALRVMGARKCFWGGIEDTHIEINREIIRIIEEAIAEVRPHFVFCPFPQDTHQDHRHLAQMTISASRYIHNVVYYEGPTTERFEPDVYVDIAPTLERKIALLKTHRSQVMKTNIEGVSIVDIAFSSANFRGIQGRVKYAEAFCGLRLFINI